MFFAVNLFYSIKIESEASETMSLDKLPYTIKKMFSLLRILKELLIYLSC